MSVGDERSENGIVDGSVPWLGLDRMNGSFSGERNLFPLLPLQTSWTAISVFPGTSYSDRNIVLYFILLDLTLLRAKRREYLFLPQ